MPRRTRLYQVLDKVSEMVIGQTISAKSDAQVIRSFHDMLQQQPFVLHMPDYDLIVLAEQEEDGTIVPVDYVEGNALTHLEFRPQVVATGAAVFAQLEKKQQMAEQVQLSLLKQKEA